MHATTTPPDKGQKSGSAPSARQGGWLAVVAFAPRSPHATGLRSGVVASGFVLAMALAVDLDANPKPPIPTEEHSTVPHIDDDDELFVVQLVPRAFGAQQLVSTFEREGINPKVEIKGVHGRKPLRTLIKKLCNHCKLFGGDAQLDLYAADERTPFAEDIQVRPRLHR